MVRLGISVEGVTEERFIKILLEPYLSERNIYITPISMDGKISINRIRHELKNMVYGFDFVTTFYDFYGFKDKETAPSKRLEKSTNYRKTTHGPNIAKEIGINKMREMCLGFNDWLTKIETLTK